MPIDLTSFMDALGSLESNNKQPGLNYSAVSPAGALGAYQIMPANLPAWGAAAGYPGITPQQFLSNPAAQDAIASTQMQAYFDKYGDWGSVAQAWLGGPGSIGKNVVDPYSGISSNSYAGWITATAEADYAANQQTADAGSMPTASGPGVVQPPADVSPDSFSNPSQSYGMPSLGSGDPNAAIAPAADIPNNDHGVTLGPLAINGDNGGVAGGTAEVGPAAAPASDAANSGGVGTQGAQDYGPGMSDMQGGAGNAPVPQASTDNPYGTLGDGGQPAIQGPGSFTQPQGAGVQMPDHATGGPADSGIAPAAPTDGSSYAGGGGSGPTVADGGSGAGTGNASGAQVAGDNSAGSGGAGGGGGGGGGSWEQGGGVQAIASLTKGVGSDTQTATQGIQKDTQSLTQNLGQDVQNLDKTANQTTTAIDATANQTTKAVESTGSNWLVRGALILLGAIFVAQGLSMFKVLQGIVPSPLTAARVTGRTVRKVGAATRAVIVPGRS